MAWFRCSSAEAHLYNSSIVVKNLMAVVVMMWPFSILTAAPENVREVQDNPAWGKNITGRQKEAAFRHSRGVYLHDRNTEVGVDEGCGATCLDRAELWKRTFLQSCVLCLCDPVMKSYSVCGTVFKTSLKAILFLKNIIQLNSNVRTEFLVIITIITTYVSRTKLKSCNQIKIE